MSDNDVCAWHGVGCKSGNVYSLNLENNTLLGTMPDELGTLTTIGNVFDLSANYLTGTIPTEIALLTGIQVFALDQNFLTGEQTIAGLDSRSFHPVVIARPLLLPGALRSQGRFQQK